MAAPATADKRAPDGDSLDTELSRLNLPGYQFTRKIGEGGMAAVYVGKQLSLARPVAIKVLDRHMGRHDQVYQAFEREAVIIARLNHPNIIHVIDRGIFEAETDEPDTAESGTPYFIMEYVDGVDLATLMREGQLPLQKKIEICLQICKALSYAHKNGVIHRDVKPANVLVDSELHVKVLDFGIALFNAGKSSDCNDGSERDIMGTYNYMAPELKDSVTTATVRSDIYSLGVVMYELFAGYLPKREQRAKPAGAGVLPPTMATLTMECLAENPYDRPRSMVDIHDRLLKILHGSHLDKRQVQQARDTIQKKSFSLLDVLKEDRHGAVYLFIEKHSGRHFVVKKMLGSFDGFETAKRLAAVTHPNIAQVHGASKNQRAFIVVMDYVKGGSLRDRLLKPYKLEEFTRLAQQMCRGLMQAHDQQILHGNLRPDSILFDEDDNIKIADFGIKSFLDEDEAQSGDKKRKANHTNYRLLQEPLCPQADIYALGIIFHLMLIGVLPRYHHREFQPGRAFKRLPVALQGIMEKMLKHHVVNRPDNVNEVLQVLDQFSTEEPTELWSVEDDNVTCIRPETRQEKRKKVLLLLVLGLLFLVLVNTGIIALFDTPSNSVSSWLQKLQSWWSG